MPVPWVLSVNMSYSRAILAFVVSGILAAIMWLIVIVGAVASIKIGSSKSAFMLGATVGDWIAVTALFAVAVLLTIVAGTSARMAHRVYAAKPFSIEVHSEL